MSKFYLFLMLFVSLPVQAGWEWIDGHHVWVPTTGEPMNPPISLFSGADFSDFQLSRRHPGWRYDQSHAPHPTPVAPPLGGDLVPGQSQAIAHGVNYVSNMIGLEVPVANHDELHTSQRLSESRATQYRDQMKSLQSFLQRLDAAPTPSVCSSAASTLVNPVDAGLNRWLSKKAKEVDHQLHSNLNSFETSEIRAESSRWKDFSMAKKQVLLLASEYSALGVRRNAAGFTHDELQGLVDVSIQVGLSSLTDAARVAGGGMGDFCDAFEISKSTLEIAKGMLDVGLSLTPGISVGKDAYEALTGKSLIDGAPLDLTSRSFAVLGVVTAGGSNIVKSSLKGLVKIAEVAHARRILGVGFHSAIQIAGEGVTNISRHSLINPGALHEARIILRGWEDIDMIPREIQAMQTVADTFRSGTYYAYKTASESTSLYRLASASGGSIASMIKVETTTAHYGHYWTRTPPLGPSVGMIDSALEKSWGNNANVWIQIDVPAGEHLFEGVSASIQRIGNHISEFVGGGDQVYIPKNIPKEWIKEIGVFQ